MPDEPVVELVESKGAAPAIDMDALGRLFDQKLQDGMGQVLRSVQQPPKPRVEPVADPVGDMVRPYVEPALREATFRADAASDKADFYAEYGQDLDADERKEVEKTFKAMAENGRPMSRKDVWAWQQGTDLDKAIERKTRKAAAKVDLARQAGDVGGNSGKGGGSTTPVDPYSLDDDNLNKALAGVSF